MKTVGRVSGLLWVTALLGSVAACSVLEDVGEGEAAQTAGRSHEASLYQPGNRFSGWTSTAIADEYLDTIQPLLGQRCVTCHGCTTSPCQLKLTSYEGIMRGANAHNIFDNTIRSSPTGPTRLIDGVTAEDWKAKGFYSVVEGGKSSVMYRMLEHGNEDNRPDFDTTNAFGLFSKKAELLKFECNDSNAKLARRVSASGTGMPFGVPALPPSEYTALTDWLERGAPGPSADAKKALAAPRDQDAVTAWEDFFNQPSAKAQLASRFLYEHLYYGRMHIDDSATSRGDYFDLVRSKTKTGAIEEIVTERPNDDPRVSFYYRFKKHTQIITAKDHSVIHLSSDVKARWAELLFDSDWNTSSVPGYSDKNPFAYFAAIPGKARYQLMLETSHHLIDAMVKGDVCNGSTATYAIRDRFFAVFLKPEADPSAIDPRLGKRDYAHLDPANHSIFRDNEFEGLFETELRKLHPRGLSEADVWDGGKKDKNALITVFRHGNNASAHQGPLGQFPETMWLMDFGNFERLYYDLVVLYRPWGELTHKLMTWNQMSHVRAHGEDLFLFFLPEDLRDQARKEFTPGWARFTEISMTGSGFPTSLADIDRARPLKDVVSRIRKHLGAQIAGFTTLDPDPMAEPPAAPETPRDRAGIEAALLSLTTDRGKISEEFPDVTWITVEGGSEPLEYTILANRIYWSNSRVIGDSLPGLSRRPEMDSIGVVRGHIGAFPQLFIEVPIGEVGEALKAVKAGHDQRVAFRRRYEIRRSSNQFWSFLDREHARRLEAAPLDAGIIDTSRYLWPLALQSSAVGNVE